MFLEHRLWENHVCLQKVSFNSLLIEMFLERIPNEVNLDDPRFSFQFSFNWDVLREELEKEVEEKEGKERTTFNSLLIEMFLESAWQWGECASLGTYPFNSLLIEMFLEGNIWGGEEGRG